MNAFSCIFRFDEDIATFLSGLTHPIIITDTNVEKILTSKISQIQKIVIPAGEDHKTLETVHSIYTELLALKADRSTTLVGIGGGVVCDITGYVAATFMRSLPFGFIPTTLLSQVDASIGGKNGVNFQGYKNIIGTVRHPSFCLINVDFLVSLPKEEILNGLAEVVKHACIGNNSLFSFLEQNAHTIPSLPNDLAQKMIKESLQVKMNIVAMDENDLYQRHLLNFGHTFAHALEKFLGLSHGKAVSCGMVIDAHLSAVHKGLPEHEVKRLQTLLANLGLPTRISLSKEHLEEAFYKDKKRCGETICIPLLSSIGQATLIELPVADLVNEAYIASTITS